MDTYELVIKDNEDGVMAISLVDAPAIEYNFVTLSKQNKIEVMAMDAERKTVIGLALVPDKPILRYENEKEFNIIFSKDTVRELSRLYLKNLRNNNATIQHESLTTGAHISESWIVDDPDMDKINLYGIKAPQGAWAISMKVTDEDLWKEIKAGKYVGFSIEGYFERAKTPEQRLQDIVNILSEYGG
jgi:hypothetical protein